MPVTAQIQSEGPLKSVKLLRTTKADDEVRDNIRLVMGTQPYKHNYYTDDQFFVNDARKGTVHNIYGQRVMYVSEDFITGLQEGLETEVGDAASEIMYKCGYRWGMEDMKSFTERARAEFEVEFRRMGVGMMLETWWWPLTIQGWGSWRYDFSQARQGLIFIDLFESAVAQSLGDIGKVVCHFYAGMFSAVLSSLAKRELSGIEIQCYSMGEDYCKFLIASSKRVNAAAFWKNEGASAKDIMAKVAEVG